MTKRECAVITAYTDATMLKGDDLKYRRRVICGRGMRDIPAKSPRLAA